MLEAGSHQAARLCALATPSGPRVVAVVSHGDRESELPLLWQLCSVWSALDYPVVVLDATAGETPAAPGLIQLLHDSEHLAHLGRGPQPWLIVPAAQGLAELGHSPAAPNNLACLRQLGDMFHSHEVVVLYATAETLASVLPASALAPLLPVSSSENALLTAYQALKHLLNIGSLRPTIAAVMDHHETSNNAALHGGSLQACARDFLASELPTLQVRLQLPHEIRQLAMRLLECAPSTAPVDALIARSH